MISLKIVEKGTLPIANVGLDERHDDGVKDVDDGVGGSDVCLHHGGLALRTLYRQALRDIEGY